MEEDPPGPPPSGGGPASPPSGESAAPAGPSVVRGDSLPVFLPIIDPQNATFVTLHCESQKLASLNSFLIRKVIDGCAGSVDHVRKLNTGDLLIKTREVSQVRDLLKLRKFHCYDVVASVPVAQNSCKGVAYCREFVSMTETEIVYEMSDQQVIEAKFIMRTVDGMRNKTPAVILTFGKATLPDYVNVGYERCSIRIYVPNPLRCFKCQQYRHHENSCHSSEIVCGRCAERGHKSDGCIKAAKCVNCGGPHPSTARDCPKWLVAEEVCTVKATSGVSYFEARKKVEELHATPRSNVSYASAATARPVMKSVGTQTCSVSTQTDPVLPTPQQSQQPSESSSTPTTSVPPMSIPISILSPRSSLSAKSFASPHPSPASSPSVRSKTTYSGAASNSKSAEKSGNSDKDKLKFTKLNNSSTYQHVLPAPPPARETSRSRSRSGVGSPERMEGAGKPRQRSPDSPKSKNAKKRNKAKHISVPSSSL